jgi:hypothetical protein
VIDAKELGDTFMVNIEPDKIEIVQGGNQPIGDLTAASLPRNDRSSISGRAYCHRSRAREIFRPSLCETSSR